MTFLDFVEENNPKSNVLQFGMLGISRISSTVGQLVYEGSGLYNLPNSKRNWEANFIYPYLDGSTWSA